MTDTIKVLIFVEDPGAANYVAPLPAALLESGISCRLLAQGAAVPYLRDRNISATELAPETGAKELLDELRPLLVVVGTSENKRSLGLRLIDAAVARGAVSAAVIDLPVNADRRFRGEGDSPFTHKPDWILVPDEATRHAYEELGYPEQRLVECGHPHFDRVLEFAQTLEQIDRLQIRKRVLPAAPLHMPVVVFVSEPASVLDPPQSERSDAYTLTGWGQSDRRTDIVLEEVLTTLKQAPVAVYLVVRLHPKNRAEEFSNYIQDIDQIDSGGDPLELIWVSDLVIGMSSMLLFEAALLGKRTLSVLPRSSERLWMAGTANNSIPCAITREELQECLVDALSPTTDAPVSNAGNRKQPLNNPGATVKRGGLKRVIEFITARLGELT